MSQHQHAEDTAAFIRSLRERALEKHRRNPVVQTNLVGARERLEEHRRLMSRLAAGVSHPPSAESPHPAALLELADPPDPEEREQTARDRRSIIEQLSQEPQEVEIGTEGPQVGGTAVEPVATESGWKPVGIYRNLEVLDTISTDVQECPIVESCAADIFEQVEEVMLCAAVDAIPQSANSEVEDEEPKPSGFLSIAPLPLKRRQRVDAVPPPSATTYADLPAIEEIEEPLIGVGLDACSPAEQTGRSSRPLPRFATLDAFDMEADEEDAELVLEEAAAPRMKVTMTRSKKRSFWPFGGQQD